MLVPDDLRSSPAVQSSRVYRGPQYVLTGYLMVYAVVLTIRAPEASHAINSVRVVKRDSVVACRATDYKPFQKP